MVHAMTASPSDIQRLVGDIIRPGLVASVDLASDPPSCTVEIGDMTTGPLPFSTVRAGRMRIWSPPSVGEQVSLLCPEGDTNAGIVMPALFCDAFPPPSRSPDVAMIAFDDGSALSYDMAAHHLAIALAGGTAAIDAPGGITINGDVTIQGALTASDDVKAGGVSLKGHKHSGVQPGGGQSGVPQ